MSHAFPHSIEELDAILDGLAESGQIMQDTCLCPWCKTYQREIGEPLCASCITAKGETVEQIQRTAQIEIERRQHIDNAAFYPEYHGAQP